MTEADHGYCSARTRAARRCAARSPSSRVPAASANADWAAASKNGFFVLLLDQADAAAWPITATTYILVYKNPPDQKATQDTLKFFQWSFEKGGQLALGLDYVPLPDAAIKSIEASWKANIQGSGM